MTAWRWSLILLLGIVLEGCGGAPADAPTVAPVRGKVTRKGQPLKGALVVYSPLAAGEKGSSPSTGVTNDQGEYTLVYNRNLDGATIGKNQVRISLGDGLSDEDDSVKDPTEIVIPPAVGNKEVDVPAEGLNGGAADFDLDF